MFRSKTTQAIMKSKYENVWNLNLILTILYFIYLMFVIFYMNRETMFPWFLIFAIKELILAIEVSKLFGIREFFKGLLSFWNSLDYMRILSILYYVIVYTDYEDSDEETNSASFLILTSILMFLEYLRPLPYFAFILTLLRQSLNDMAYFAIVLFIIN
jgi:hypothetical protein